MRKLSFHFQFSSGRKTGLVNQMIVDRAIFLEAEDLADASFAKAACSWKPAKLSEGFFEQLQGHPLPVEEAAIKSLNNQSVALIVHLWLSYRLHVLNKDLTISSACHERPVWQGIQEAGWLQVMVLAPAGPLAVALAVYPAAKVEVSNSGLILKPSKPPVAPRLVSSGG